MSEPGAKDGPPEVQSKSELDARIRAATEHQPIDVEALHVLGLEASAAGRPGDALELISRAVEISPQNKTFILSAAKVLMSEGMFQQAALAYLRAQEIDPKDPGILVGLASALARSNKDEEARAVLARADELGRAVESPSGARRPSIILASSGYCGAASLVNALERHGFRRAGTFLSKFTDLPADSGGIIYETHALPPASLPDGYKVVFLFGNPVVSIVSAHEELNRWGKQHFARLGAVSNYVENTVLLHGDPLRLAEHFGRWFQYHPFPVLAARYPDVFSRECTLAVAQFIQTEFAVATFEQRTVAKEARVAVALRETFKELVQRVESARPITVLGDTRG